MEPGANHILKAVLNMKFSSPTKHTSSWQPTAISFVNKFLFLYETYDMHFCDDNGSLQDCHN